MKALQSKQLHPPAATSERYLPGLSPFECGTELTDFKHDTISRSGWWVRRSQKQIMDAAGQPVGFRHQLMDGRTVVRTGVGADNGRAFREQADFLNRRDKSAPASASSRLMVQ